MDRLPCLRRRKAPVKILLHQTKRKKSIFMVKMHQSKWDGPLCNWRWQYHVAVDPSWLKFNERMPTDQHSDWKGGPTGRNEQLQERIWHPNCPPVSLCGRGARRNLQSVLERWTIRSDKKWVERAARSTGWLLLRAVASVRETAVLVWLRRDEANMGDACREPRTGVKTGYGQDEKRVERFTP